MAEYPELAQAIGAADGKGAAAAFCRALRAGAPAPDLVGAAVRTAAPLVNLPFHVYLDDDGRLVRREVNHAFPGLAAAVELQQPEALAWGVYHLAAGCRRQPLAWAEGAAADASGGQALVTAVLEARPADAWRLWLGAAADPAGREELRERLRFCGAINLEESIDRQLRHLGHKAIFVEATLTLLDYLGWESAPQTGLPGIAFLATGPQLYPVYDLLWSRSLFPMAEVVAENSFDLGEDDQAALARTILRGDREHVIQHLSDLINAGHSLTSVGDTVAVAAAELVLETSPGDWFVPLHGLTYTAALNRWVRQGSSALRVYAPCLAALFVNDISRFYRKEDYIGLADDSDIPAGDPVSRTLTAIDRGDMPAAAALAQQTAGAPLLAALVQRAARWGAQVHTMKLAAAVQGEFAQSNAASKAALPAALAKFLTTADRDEGIYRLCNG